MEEPRVDRPEMPEGYGVPETSDGLRENLVAAEDVSQHGFKAIKHQSFVGAGYFDEVQMTITGGESSTTALKGSTEEAQFEMPALALMYR